MDQYFKDKSARILLVTPAATMRNQHREILKEQGFASVNGVSDLSSGLEILETEPIDWVITPVLKDQPINAFQILKLTTSHSHLRHVRVSLIIDEQEKEILEDAFDMGLLCFFFHKTSKNEIAEEYTKFFGRLQRKAFNTCKVSSEYLKDILSGKPSQLLDFFKKFIQIFPGDSYVLLDLAKAYFLNQKKQSALSLLKQIVLINPKLENPAKELATKYQDMDPASETIETQNTLHIKHIAVLDPNAEVLNHLQTIFQEAGIPSINCFQSAEQLLSFDKLSEIELLIFEWAVPDIPSPIMIQKLTYERNLVSVPFIALSDSLGKADLPLLRELGIINYCPKPIEQSQFFKTIVWSLQQQIMPSEPGTMELKIREHILCGNMVKAKGLFAHFMQHKDVEKFRIFQFEAEFAYYDDKYFLGKTKCLDAIRLGGDSVFILSLLGKILMKLRDFSAALRCLDLAHSMSPLNLKRICAISECYMENDDLKNAETTLDIAIELDSEFEEVKQTQTKLNILQGNTDNAKNLMKDIASVKSVISFMNNRAVSLSVCKRIEEGIELYRKTLDSIPDESRELLAQVHYNLALAHIRNTDFESALDELKIADSYKVKRMTLKIKDLVHRLKKSQKEGSEFKLKNPILIQDKSEQEKDEESKDYIASLAIRKGEICCHKIFIKMPYSELVKEWTKRQVNFNPRQAIVRGANFQKD